MSLAHYEVAYHLADNPNRTHVIRLLLPEGSELINPLSAER